MDKYCDGCPMRLYNEKCHNLKGIGNPIMGNLILVPNVDYVAYKNKSMQYSNLVDIICDILSTGVLENIYILPYIRCNANMGYPITPQIEQRCIHYLMDDITKYNFSNILLLGDTVNKLLGDNITDSLNTIRVSKNKRYYASNYSPLIKYIDKDKYEIFKNNLIRWYNNVINHNYLNYNMYYD